MSDPIQNNITYGQIASIVSPLVVLIGFLFRWIYVTRNKYVDKDLDYLKDHQEKAENRFIEHSSLYTQMMDRLTTSNEDMKKTMSKLMSRYDKFMENSEHTAELLLIVKEKQLDTDTKMLAISEELLKINKWMMSADEKFNKLEDKNATGK